MRKLMMALLFLGLLTLHHCVSDTSGDFFQNQQDQNWIATFNLLSTAGEVITSLPADGESTAWLQAVITDRHGAPQSDVTVTFTASHGHLSAGAAVTDATGAARVQITSSLEVTDSLLLAARTEDDEVSFLGSFTEFHNYRVVLTPDRTTSVVGDSVRVQVDVYNEQGELLGDMLTVQFLATSGYVTPVAQITGSGSVYFHPLQVGTFTVQALLDGVVVADLELHGADRQLEFIIHCPHDIPLNGYTPLVGEVIVQDENGVAPEIDVDLRLHCPAAAVTELVVVSGGSGSFSFLPPISSEDHYPGDPRQHDLDIQLTSLSAAGLDTIITVEALGGEPDIESLQLVIPDPVPVGTAVPFFSILSDAWGNPLAGRTIQATSETAETLTGSTSGETATEITDALGRVLYQIRYPDTVSTDILTISEVASGVAIIETIELTREDSVSLYLGYPSAITVTPGGSWPVSLVASQSGSFIPDGTTVSFASTLGTMVPFETTIINGAARSDITDLPVGVEGEFVVVALIQGQTVVSDPPIQLLVEVSE